jgi:hypothetical protein
MKSILSQRLATGERSKSDVGHGGKMQKPESSSLKKNRLLPMIHHRGTIVHADRF